MSPSFLQQYLPWGLRQNPHSGPVLGLAFLERLLWRAGVQLTGQGEMRGGAEGVPEGAQGGRSSSWIIETAAHTHTHTQYIYFVSFRKAV